MEALNDGEQPQDRPDLCAGVFHLKLSALMDDLLKVTILGKVKAYVYTTEWQKRGLTHCHILLIMADEYKPRTPEIIDKVASAELPDEDTSPVLHNLVVRHMINGPCAWTHQPNPPCMEQKGSMKTCTKAFPKAFMKTTLSQKTPSLSIGEGLLQMAAIPRPCKFKEQRIPLSIHMLFTQPLLLLRYQAHVNVEVVHSVQAVKDLYKYITKGQDHVILSVWDGNTETYLNTRYISASEALWHIYGYEIHKKQPPVEKLPCHLPDEQLIFQDEAQEIVQRGPPVTKLMAYFETDRTDPSARTILYPDFPVTLLGTARKNRGRDANEVLPRTLAMVKWSVMHLDTSLLFPRVPINLSCTA